MRTKLFPKHVLSALAVVLLALSALPVFAQESSDWYLDKTIKSVQFQGLNSIKASDLEGVTSSFTGKKFTYDLWEEMVNRVYALNYFESVEPQAVPGDASYSTVKIIFVVKENPVVSRIEFKGNSQLRYSELKEAISIKEKDIFIESKVLVDERALRDFYIEKGYTAVRVSSSTERDDEGVVITFNVSEGKQTIVKTIIFEGNQVISSRTLKGKISLKEAGLINKGSFQEASLYKDRETIVNYYQNKGYVDAQVLDVKQDTFFNEEKQRDELTITFVIQEGSQYTFGGITFTGNRVFSTEQLESLVKLEAGKLYSQTKVEESFLAVRNLYHENGYTYTTMDPKVTKDTENKIISYKMVISEAARSHVEDVIIRGNGKTKDEVIRREIPVESGDVYNISKIYTGLRNLYNLQYFSDVQPDVQQGSEEGLVDLIFNVEETSTTTLDFGFTFSGVSDPDEFPIALYAKIQDSNLFGEGRSVSGSVTLSTDEQSFSVGYGQNWLFNLPVSTSLSASYTHANTYTLIDKFLPDGTISDDDYYMEYEEHEFNLSGSMGRRWTPDWAILTATAGISGSLVNNIYDSTLYTPVDATVSDYNNNWEPKNCVFGSFAMDDRDVNYDPSKGWFVSQRLSWYGLLPQGTIPFAEDWGETQFYLRTDTKGELYFTLVNKPVSENWNLKLVLAGYSGLSLELPAFGSSIKKSNQLYIDGMFYGRGWSIYSYKRGLAQWNNTLELRMPLIPNVLSTDIFFDASLLKDSTDELITDFGNMDDWYFSFGPSLRFSMQQFPLRLLLCSTFKVEDGAVVWKDEYENDVDSFLDSIHFVLSFNITNK